MSARARGGRRPAVSAFLTLGAIAEQAIASETVRSRWEESAALTGYTVGGLAGHLARAVLSVERYLDRPRPDLAPTDAPGYLVRVLGAHDPVDSDFHREVRRRAAEQAEGGAAALAGRLEGARLALADRLDDLGPDRLVAVLDDTVLPLDEYLLTRQVELVVHLDDLAVSVGLDGADGLPSEAVETVAAVLARVAARRVGGLATVRSLARRERHPDAVRAL